jgi:hypothetical protein
VAVEFPGPDRDFHAWRSFQRAFQKLMAEMHPQKLIWMRCGKPGCKFIGKFYPPQDPDEWVECTGCASYAEPSQRIGRMKVFTPEQADILEAAGRLGGRDAVLAVINAEGWW